MHNKKTDPWNQSLSRMSGRRATSVLVRTSTARAECAEETVTNPFSSDLPDVPMYTFFFLKFKYIINLNWNFFYECFFFFFFWIWKQVATLTGYSPFLVTNKVTSAPSIGLPSSKLLNLNQKKGGSFSLLFE